PPPAHTSLPSSSRAVPRDLHSFPTRRSSDLAQENFKLEAPEVLDWVDEYGDSIGLHILTVFPTFTLQQTRNSLAVRRLVPIGPEDRKSTRLNSSHVKISYAVFCLKKKKRTQS